MAAPSPPAQRAPTGAWPHEETGVTPVLGSILVLAITVVGIAGVLFWGAPTIDRIQTRNAQSAVQGQFIGLRDATMELSVPDHSRFPSVALPGGTLQLARGTRFMVTAGLDPGATACDFHVSAWSDSGAQAATFSVVSPGCKTLSTYPCASPTAAGVTCLEVFSVSTTSTLKQTVTGGAGTYTVAGADFSQGDWMFRLSDNGANPVVHAQAWLLSSDQLAWSLPASTGGRAVFEDGGAVFGQGNGVTTLESAATIGDSSFGNGYYGLWLRTLVASGYTGISGQGSHQVYFSLLGNSLRTDSNAAYRLRYDFSGSLAQPWCNAMLLRNGQLAAAAYAESPGYTCSTGDVNQVRSVTYTCSDPVKCVGGKFQLRFLHARIHTSLVV